MSKDTKGFLFGVMAALCYALMLFFAKLGKQVPNEIMVFIRNLAFLLFTLTLTFQSKFTFKTKKIGLHIIRATFGLLAIYCFFYVVRHLSLIESNLFFNTVPLFIPLVLLLWLKKKIPLLRLISLIIGFVGILFVLNPAFTSFHMSMIIGILGGIFTAIAHVSVRRLSKTESTVLIMFYFALIATTISMFPALFYLKDFFQLGFLWVYILLAALFSFLFQAFITKAYSLSAVSKVSSTIYFTVAFGALLDWVGWGRIPNLSSIIGTVLIVGGGLCVIFLDKKNKIIS
jgi:drug/metabolite transporter (DMT)-like permease